MRDQLVAILSTWLPAEALVPHAAGLWLVGILLAFVADLYLADRSGLDPRPAYWAGLCAIAGALVAGRAWMVLFANDVFTASLFVDILVGKKSIMGMVIGAAVGAWLALRLARQPVLEYMDAAVPAGFLGYAIARAGCLLAGCCYGTPTDLPWGIHYPYDSEPYLAQLHSGLIGPAASQSLAVHPIPVYHATLALLLAYLTLKRGETPGRPVAIALVGYGTGRFLLEFLRGDAVPTMLGLSVAQLGSVVFVIAGMTLWIFSRCRDRNVTRAWLP